MNTHSKRFSEISPGLPADLCERWQELCSRYLPLCAENSIWRFSRAATLDEPEQGWKLHISATVLTACTILEKIAPLLHIRDIQFKAPASILEINKINSGIFYGYSQIGKLITIYPRSAEDAVSLARQVHEFTRHISAPAVPFDRKFRPDGCVYYRYGAFRQMEIENSDGTRTPAIRDSTGHLIPDVRDCATAQPVWATDPFAGQEPSSPDIPDESLLMTTYRAFRALTQRGRGGVYEAVDLSVTPARLCILKEGRRDGELSWDGRDGYWRIRHEEQVIRSLRASGINAPRVYSSFIAEGNYYLVTELIEGETLQDFLLRRRRRLPVAQGLQIGAKVSFLLSRIHAAGWTWRDCKPGNIMMNRGAVRALDFEGACPPDSPDPMPWGTQGFTPAEWRPSVESREYEDLYALGATLYLLLTGRVPESSPLPVEKLRRNVPPEACHLISELLTADPQRQPSAQTVAQGLLSIFCLLPVSHPKCQHFQPGAAPLSLKRQQGFSRIPGGLAQESREHLRRL